MIECRRPLGYEGELRIGEFRDSLLHSICTKPAILALDATASFQI